jgi:hypothetical protein
VRSGQKTDTVNLTIQPGAKAIISDLNGSGAITALKVSVDHQALTVRQKQDLLRQLALSITWDDDKSPAVWSPIGDFFADPLYSTAYQGLPVGAPDVGQWYSYWYMPYASRAKIELQNDGAIPITMHWDITHAPLTQPIDTLLRFHAKWHNDAFQPTRKDRAPDWTILKTEGVGRFVGTQLHGWIPKPGWWGEGDEKFFVDGEKFPSSFGTGSEDYFGYAWASQQLFSQALHGQVLYQEAHVAVHRWHIPDNVPFQKSFEGCIEKYFPNDGPALYDAVACWYLAPGGTDGYPEIPIADRVGHWAPRRIPYIEPDAIEAESLHA